MTKKTFTKLLEEYIAIDVAVGKLNKALKVFDPDFNYFIFSRYKDLFLGTIKDAMNDKEDWIGYFLFEMDAKFSKKPKGKFKDGKPIYIRNFDDLYNLIN